MKLTKKAKLTKEELDTIVVKATKEEADRVRAMSPEERAAYAEKNKKWKAFVAHMNARSEMTNGEIMAQEIFEKDKRSNAVRKAQMDAYQDATRRVRPIIENGKKNTSDARGNQRGAQKRIEKLEAKTKKLEAENAQLKRERDEILARLMAVTGAKVVK